ncbi:MAG: M16 family metallopeptidase [Bdellovibrionota bacterium]
MAARSPARPQFKKTVFPNGLTLLTERHPQFRSLSMGVWVKVGTRHERGTEAGASHFLEHMLFKGTERRTALDIAKEVDQVGGEFNAFTAREDTCFHLLLLDRDVNLGIDILGDVILNSQFASEEVERERRVILQEIAMVEESPEELVHDIFFELVYGTHGLGKPILGTERSIRRMKRGEILRFFHKYYRPDQLILSVAGDVTHEEVKRKLKPWVSRRWPGRNHDGKLALPAAAPPKLKPGFWWVERPTEQVHVVWGVPGPSYASKDRFAAFLLNVYLGGGMSSSLFQEIREKNALAYDVYSNLSPFSDSGVFSIYVATGMDRVLLCLKLIEECAETIKSKLLPKEEIQTIKDNLKGTILLSADSVEARMSSIAKNEIFLGRYVGVEEVCRQIDEVTPEDLRRVARQILKSDDRSVLCLGPKPSKQITTKLRPVRPRQYYRT